MLKDKGEKDVKSTAWAEVNTKHGERNVILERTMTVEFQTSNNPLAKKCPAARTFKVIEKSDELLVMIVVTKVQDVPYANDFVVEEEWYAACKPSSTSCCALRISYQVVFNKKTLTQKIIVANV